MAKFPLVVPKAGHTRDAIEQLFHERRLKPNFTMELDSSELLKRFVAADVGIGFIARSNVEEDVRAKVLAAIAIADAQVRRDLALVFRKDKALSRAALAFIDIAVKHKSTRRIGAISQADDAGRFQDFCSRCASFLLGSACPRARSLFPRSRCRRVPQSSQKKLIAIKVTGSKRFPADAIAVATGLQMGAAVDDDEFKKAARRLGDTGVFTEIGYTFSYSTEGTKVEFQVTDADKFVPAHFEDFVWFTEAELRKRIKEHAPLFDGELPVFGRMADQVSDVLQAMLVENAIPGHVEYVRTGKADGPVESINYRVTDVLIQIRNIEFTGAGEAEVPALEAAEREAG